MGATCQIRSTLQTDVKHFSGQKNTSTFSYALKRIPTILAIPCIISKLNNSCQEHFITLIE